MKFDKRDYDLSMAISRRSVNEPAPLRSLLVHRLTDTAKAVARRSIQRSHQLGVYCEPCGRWGHPFIIPLEMWRCPRCGRVYRLETAVYAEVQAPE